MRTVPLTNFELVRILAGNPMTCRTLDGEEIQVRLFTADELLEAVEQAGRKLEEQGSPPGPGMSYAKAVELTTPIGNR